MIGGGVSVAVVLVMACFLASQADAQTYEIVFTRFSNSNGVTLTCRLNGGNTFIGSASFFQNGTITISITDAATESYTFIVDRLANEGQYTCGSTVSDSNSVNVIANPSFDHQVAFDGSITIRAKNGTTAVLPPYIRPGIWLSRYHIDWKNRTDTNEILVEAISGLRNTLINPGIERFSVDLNSFSLIIEKVTRTDAGNYFGELGVMETEGASKMNYMQTIDMGIRLEVYEEPKIIQQIQDVTIKYEENTSAQFTCTAKGFPAPTISWKHNGITVSASSTKYSVEEIAPNQDSEDTVTRMLMIHDIHPVDSGSVRCVATVEPGGNIPPVKASKIVAFFSVLKIFDVGVYRTDENNLFFVVDIGDDVMIPIGLRIQLDFENGQEPFMTPKEYRNTNFLTHVYNDPPEASTVTVTIVESRGSISSPSRIKDLPTVKDCSVHQRLINIVTPSGSALVIVCIFCISFVCCFRYWGKNKEAIRNHNNLSEVLRKPDSTPEDRRVALGILVYSFGGRWNEEASRTEYITTSSKSGARSTPSSTVQPNGANLVPGNGSCGPPPPFQESGSYDVDEHQSSSAKAVTYNREHCTENEGIRITTINGCHKIRGKGSSSSRRTKNKKNKECSREEAIQIANGLFSG